MTRPVRGQDERGSLASMSESMTTFFTTNSGSWAAARLQSSTKGSDRPSCASAGGLAVVSYTCARCCC